MRRHALKLAFACLILCLLCFLFIPGVSFSVLGIFRNERFYNGRPISYWIHLLEEGQNKGAAMEALRNTSEDSAPALLRALAEAEALDTRGGDVAKDEVEWILRDKGLEQLANQ